MASEVDIANLALANLGDAATVSSLSPPEGSAQAEHCARFYPIARDTLLEMHCWNFATRRITLALVASPGTPWSYAYAVPSDAVTLIAVIPIDATDDYAGSINTGYTWLPNNVATSYTPVDFVTETDADGNRIILTDQATAVLRYVARVTDTMRFSPLFVTALSWLLSSMLAGSLLKGDAGAAESKRCMAMVQHWLSQAMLSDANQRSVKPAQSVGWMAGR